MSTHITLPKLLSTDAVDIDLLRLCAGTSCSIHLDMWHKLGWLQGGFLVNGSARHPLSTWCPPHLETCKFCPHGLLTLFSRTMFLAERNAMKRLKQSNHMTLPYLTPWSFHTLGTVFDTAYPPWSVSSNLSITCPYHLHVLKVLCQHAAPGFPMSYRSSFAILLETI